MNRQRVLSSTYFRREYGRGSCPSKRQISTGRTEIPLSPYLQFHEVSLDALSHLVRQFLLRDRGLLLLVVTHHNLSTASISRANAKNQLAIPVSASCRRYISRTN